MLAVIVGHSVSALPRSIRKLRATHRVDPAVVSAGVVAFCDAWYGGLSGVQFIGTH
jgi:hypothetical protein